MKGVSCLMALGLFLFLLAPTASAHRVNVFAWVEGDTVHTESKFSGGGLVKKGKLKIYDARGKKLLEGKTDKTGRFSFSVPERIRSMEKPELKVVILAGLGHRGEWVLLPEDLGYVAGKADAGVKRPMEGDDEDGYEDEDGDIESERAVSRRRSSSGKYAREKTGLNGTTSGRTSGFRRISSSSGEDIEKIREEMQGIRQEMRDFQNSINTTLTTKLEAMVQLFEKSAGRGGVSPGDIFGGIGYILGLAAVGFYFHTASQKKRTRSGRKRSGTRRQSSTSGGSSGSSSGSGDRYYSDE